MGLPQKRASTGPTFAVDGTTSYETFFNLQGSSISESQASKMFAVHACINVRAETYATMPKEVFRKQKDGSKTTVSVPLIQGSPNEMQTSYDFDYAMSATRDTRGNAYAYIYRDERTGTPTGLSHPINPMYVQVYELKTGAIKEYVWTIGGVAVDYNNILHLKGPSEDGILGKSPIKYMSDSIGLAKKQESYALQSSAKQPPGVIKTDEHLTAKQIQEAVKIWESQLLNGKTPLLSKGLDYNPVQISPVDETIINSIKITSRFIYSAYRVPPTLVGDYENTAYSNSEQQDLQFVKHLVSPMVEQAQQEIHRKILNNNSRLICKFNTDHLLMADVDSKTKLYQSAINFGYMTPNEVRLKQGLNPVDGADKLFLNANMIPMDQAEEFWKGRNPDSNNTEENGEN